MRPGHHLGDAGLATDLRHAQMKRGGEGKRGARLRRKRVGVLGKRVQARALICSLAKERNVSVKRDRFLLRLRTR
jgi:hypothetical protein